MTIVRECSESILALAAPRKSEDSSHPKEKGGRRFGRVNGVRGLAGVVGGRCNCILPLSRLRSLGATDPVCFWFIKMTKAFSQSHARCVVGKPRSAQDFAALRGHAPGEACAVRELAARARRSRCAGDRRRRRRRRRRLKGRRGLSPCRSRGEDSSRKPLDWRSPTDCAGRLRASIVRTNHTWRFRSGFPDALSGRVFWRADDSDAPIVREERETLVLRRERRQRVFVGWRRTA